MIPPNVPVRSSEIVCSDRSYLGNGAGTGGSIRASVRAAIRTAGAIHAGYSALTDYPLGVVKAIPYKAHLALDGLGALALAATRTPLDALDASDAEDELLEHLEDAGVPEAWRLAEPLAAAGLDAAWVDRVSGCAGATAPQVLEWVATSLTARSLAGELIDSAERMSRLVGAVKTYAYVDRGGEVTIVLP